MAAPTPSGASSMTMPVNLNIVSARLSANASIGRWRSSRSIASAEPKITLKTTTWRISPSTTDLAMFSGKMWSTISCQVRDAAAGNWLASMLAGSVMPSPAREIVMAAQPMSSASVVTTSK